MYEEIVFDLEDGLRIRLKSPKTLLSIYFLLLGIEEPEIHIVPPPPIEQFSCCEPLDVVQIAAETELIKRMLAERNLAEISKKITKENPRQETRISHRQAIRESNRRFKLRRP